jgi:poly(A) polymerase
LEAPDPGAAITLMAETGVLGAVLPEARDLTAFRRLLSLGAPCRPLLRLAALLTGSGAKGEAGEVAARLKLSTEERLGLLRRCDPALLPPADPKDKALRQWLAGHAAMAQDALLATDLAWLAEVGDGEPRAALRRRIAETPVPDFPLLGRDAVAIGIPAGPELGKLLAATRAWWLEQGCTTDRAECLAKLRELAGLPPA